MKDEPERGHLAGPGMAHAAVAVQVAERGARHRCRRVDARRPVDEPLRQVADEAALEERLQRERAFRQRFGVRREWIAIGRELQGAQAQEPRRAGFVTGRAVGARRDRVADAGSHTSTLFRMPRAGTSVAVPSGLQT